MPASNATSNSTSNSASNGNGNGNNGNGSGNNGNGNGNNGNGNGNNGNGNGNNGNGNGNGNGCDCDGLGDGQTPHIYTHKCSDPQLLDPNDCCRRCNEISGDNIYSCVAVSEFDKMFYYAHYGPLDYYCRQDSGELIAHMNR